MPWWIGGLVANVAIAWTEYLNSTSQFGYAETLYRRTGLLILLAQWGLYYAFKGAPSWMIAWAAFTIGNSIARVCAVQILSNGQIGSWPQVLAGIAVMMSGAFVLKLGLK